MKAKVTKVFLRAPDDSRFSAAMLTPDALTIKDCHRQIALDLSQVYRDDPSEADVKRLDEDLEMLGKLAALVRAAIAQQKAVRRRAVKVLKGETTK